MHLKKKQSSEKKTKSIKGQSLGVDSEHVTPSFVAKVKLIIQEYLSTQKIDDLVFEADLTNAHRKKIHE